MIKKSEALLNFLIMGDEPEFDFEDLNDEDIKEMDALLREIWRTDEHD